MTKPDPHVNTLINNAAEALATCNATIHTLDCELTKARSHIQALRLRWDSMAAAIDGAPTIETRKVP